MRWVTFMYGIAYLHGESHSFRNFSTLRRTSTPPGSVQDVSKQTDRVIENSRKYVI